MARLAFLGGNMSTPEKENAKTKVGLEKILKISIPCVLAIGFLGSILGVILTSPELKNDEEGTNVTKGLLRVNQAEYRTQYFAGEHFSFNKETALVTLVAKDPLIEDIVKVDNLPAPEYGFVVGKTMDENGNLVYESELASESQIITSQENSSQEDVSSSETHKYTTVYSEFVLDPAEIIMEKNMGTVYLVSKRYSDLRYPLSTKVYSALTEENLTNDVTLEAESADLYQDDKLLSYEEKVSKSLLSNVGNNPLSEEQAAKLSQGACLRNFNANNMKVDFIVPASKDCEVTIEVDFCARPKGGLFSSFFQVSVNDEACEPINNQNVPDGEAKQYFNPAKLTPVAISLKEGFNHITFVSGAKVGTGSPFNLDAIHLTASDDCISSLAALEK